MKMGSRQEEMKVKPSRKKWRKDAAGENGGI